jgi:hypothetical protein
MLSKAHWAVMGAAAFSLILSVFFWFVIGDERAALFIGIWVPSILASGAYLESIKERKRSKA